MASQTQKAPLKGILKKPTAAHPGAGAGASDGSSTVAVAASPSPSSGGAQKKPDPREVAIQHARIIHDRRALEDSITDSIILLAKLPTTLPTDSSISPSTTNTNTDTAAAAAAELFKTHIRLFQPSDYDALIEERNALGSCGYCLCPRPRKRFGPASGVGGGGGGGEYKILNWGRADFAIAPRAEVERWCSRGRAWCARAAMYVKVQLSETAAWERAGIESIRIELLEEVEVEEKEKEKGKRQQQDVEHKDKSDTTAAATAVITKELEREGLRLRERKEREREETDRRQKAARDARDLALERGDTDEKEAAKRSVDVTIREKRVVTGVQEPTLAPGGEEDHLVLDGYKTKFDPKSETMARGTTSTSTTIVKASDE